jgi:hypothetical protein
MHWAVLFCCMALQVFNLPIEEAAKHLGIGQTMLKHYCRKFGIPRWPYRKRQSVVQLIQSIEEYSTVRQAGRALVAVFLGRLVVWYWVHAVCARAWCSSFRALRSTQRLKKQDA